MDVERIIKDPDGARELEIREALGEAEILLRRMIADNPAFTTGELAFAAAVAFDPHVLAWFTAVLLRDRIELGV